MAEISKGYEPSSIEAKWYQFWIDKRYFTPDPRSTKPKFSAVIPPPNVTGSLHMGHALNNSLQDIIARYKRMRGFDVLWVPGTDHAGISTQIVVEKQLAKEGIKKDQLGRGKFVEKVWEWREKYGNIILGQQRSLGNSVDWTRLRFTLDDGLSKAVTKVFVDLYNEGLIYRGNRLVNWCTRCNTAVSDLEVKHVETKSSLWFIKYPFADDPDNGVTVATTRPETMLGDTAVAVNPDDPRYKKSIGKKLKLPHTDREIPLIGDPVVEKTFGSGAVKITPAHDFNDYETGLRHKLPLVSVFDRKGFMNENSYAYKGLKIADARKKVVEDLTALGLLIKEEPHALSVGRCDRCDSVVEPMLSDQWWVKIQPLAKPAITAVETGKIKFVPETWTKNYLDWMYNIKDWCISRQLWWGHRIPAWHCDDCKKITVSVTEPTQCQYCKGKAIHQDPDVLDTWFSSWLWPFTTMGWPEQTEDLKRYFPTDVLVTGFDIIFFWVARMIMSSLHFMKAIPFSTVYIHALVRDERGQKMSKSKGNVVDPLDLMKVYGTDATRFTLASLVGAGRDIRFSEERLDGYRNFINKIWNATRFVLGALESVKLVDPKDLEKSNVTLPDQYIAYEFTETLKTITQALEEYRFTDAANAAYQFTWHEFCDWYLELSKPVLYGTDDEQKTYTGMVLLCTLERIVRILHPFIPFVTEEIYQMIPGHGESVTIQRWPGTDCEYCKLGSKEAADQIQLIKRVITAIRNIRGENRISPAARIKARVTSSDTLVLNRLEENRDFISSLARLESVDFSGKDGDTKKCAVSLVIHGKLRINVVVPLEGLVDFNEEMKRLQKEAEKTNRDLELTEKKLSNETFVKNAPQEIVQQEKDRLAQLKDRRAHIQASLQRLS